MISANHNTLLEQLVNIICARTNNEDKAFFRPAVCYFFAKIASNYRATITSKDMGTVPLNLYACCLAPSGYGKGHSIGIMENDFMKGFRDGFMTQGTKELSEVASKHLSKEFGLSAKRIKELGEESGSYIYSMDSGTAPAMKQLYNKLTLMGCGALSVEVDEIGSNLENTADIMSTMLELYDKGYIKQKLTKSTNDNKRQEFLNTWVPANMLMFGTPAKVFDNGSTESSFLEYLSTGFARRCFFGYGTKKRANDYFTKSAEEIYYERCQGFNGAFDARLRKLFTSFACRPDLLNRNIEVPDSVAIALTEYRRDCEKAADALPEHMQLIKSELEHRYFKTIKLAGIFAFIRESTVVSMDDLSQAIAVAEECGESFKQFLNRKKGYVQVAEFIAYSDHPVNQVDIQEAFPWFNGTKARETITNAIAWGYNNNIVIKREVQDSIEFYSSLKLKANNLDEFIVSGSYQKADNFAPITLPWDKFAKLPVLNTGFHYCNHWFSDQHRCEKTCEDEFNFVVLDVDGTCQHEHFKSLFAKYKFITARTRSDTPEQNHYRVLLPLKYTLNMSPAEYKRFMNGVLSSLPFAVDEMSAMPTQMWTAYAGKEVYVNEGEELFDPLPFIPKTIRNAEYKTSRSKFKKLDNVQKWFIDNIEDGNRNKMLYRYAMMLKDNGKPYRDISSMVVALNNALSFPLSDNELQSTILNSVRRKVDL